MRSLAEIYPEGLEIERVEAARLAAVRASQPKRKSVLDGAPPLRSLGTRTVPLAKPADTKARVRATPFTIPDPKAVPERDWLFGRHYIRKYLTVTVGAGGGGKSAHAVTEVYAMAAGRPLLEPDGPLHRPLRVWYINAEDPRDEIDRRFAAAALHFGITNDDIGDRIFTDTGREQEFVIMRQEGRDMKLVQPMADSMVEEIKARGIDVVIVDPFVSTHELPENDNSAMQQVARAWVDIAQRGNCCVEVIHHIVKGQAEVTADSARGGGALKDKARSLRVINPMTQAEADKFGVEAPGDFFRVDLGKANMTRKSTFNTWRRFVNVPLHNTTSRLSVGDEIGVVEGWRPDAPVAKEPASAAVDPATLEGLKVRLGAADHKENEQAATWAGLVVAELLGLDATRDKPLIKAMLPEWIEAGHLQVAIQRDHHRKPAKYIKPVCGTQKRGAAERSRRSRKTLRRGTLIP